MERKVVAFLKAKCFGMTFSTSPFERFGSHFALKVSYCREFTRRSKTSSTPLQTNH